MNDAIRNREAAAGVREDSLASPLARTAAEFGGDVEVNALTEALGSIAVASSRSMCRNARSSALDHGPSRPTWVCSADGPELEKARQGENSGVVVRP
jgi:hypothetical protein